MHYRRLGRTNLMVAEVGIGTTYLARAGAEGGAEVIRAGVAAGANLIEVDTAAPDELAALALVLRALRPQLVVIGTGDASEATVAGALEASGLDYFDCYLVNDPARLADARALAMAGRTRFVGVAAHDPAEALRVVLGGEVDVVQVPRNAFELRTPTGVDAVLAAARDAEMGILACSPLGGGALSALGEPALLERLRSLTDGAPRSVAQAALAWVLSDHRLAAAVAGPSTVAQALDLTGASALAPLDELTSAKLAAALRAD